MYSKLRNFAGRKAKVVVVMPDGEEVDLTGYCERVSVSPMPALSFEGSLPVLATYEVEVALTITGTGNALGQVIDFDGSCAEDDSHWRCSYCAQLNDCAEKCCEFCEGRHA